MSKKVGLVCLILLVILAGCRSTPKELPEISENLTFQSKGTVVMLHGLWRSGYAMNPVAEYFDELGYEVVNVSYPSTQYDIPTLVDEYLLPQIDNIKQSSQGPIHFVTHSMGGILVRYLLQTQSLDELGRVVMIAPPNKGSELVDSSSGLPFVSVSPAALQIGSNQQSWVNQLAPVDFELGVIAGQSKNNLVTNSILPGPDDGVVSVASTQVDNMRDFMVIPLKHYRLRSNPYVLQQSAHFIQHGEFFRE